MSHFVKIVGASSRTRSRLSILSVYACAQINALEKKLKQKNERFDALAAKSALVERQYRDETSALVEDTSKIDMKIVSARASKPEHEGLLPIYEAHNAKELARAEAEKVQEDVKSRKETLGSIKDRLLRLRKQYQAAQKQARTQTFTKTCNINKNTHVQIQRGDEIADAFFTVRQ